MILSRSYVRARRMRYLNETIFEVVSYATLTAMFIFFV